MSKNTNFYLITNAKAAVPAAISGTGTLTTNVANTKVITGTGTLFLTELKIDDFIYDAAQNQVRKVTAISSNTTLFIDEAFTTPLAGVALKYITDYDTIVELSVINAGAVNGKVDNIVLKAGLGISYSKTNKQNVGRYANIDPITVDATGTEIAVNIYK